MKTPSIQRPARRDIVAAMLFAAFSAATTAEELKVQLSGAAEVPPVGTMASGSGSITINPDMTVSGGVTTSGVVATMAHIHQAKAGANGPVILPFARSGDNAWQVPAGARLTEAQYQAFKAGELYVNVHSAEHKAGEIRGQLLPAMMPAATAAPKSMGY